MTSTTLPPMHPRTTELLRFLDDQAAALRSAYDAVPAARRAVRTDPARWSPAEIVHHVAIVNRRMAGRIAELVEQARTGPRERETAPVVRSSPALGFGLDRTNKRVASEASQPLGTEPAQVWEIFDGAQRELRGAVERGDGLALGSVTSAHPVLGALNGYDWVVFAGAHMGRHAAQVRELTG